MLNLRFTDRFRLETQAHISPNHGLLHLESYNTDPGYLSVEFGAEAIKCLAASLSESERDGIRNLAIDIRPADLTFKATKDVADGLSRFPKLKNPVVRGICRTWIMPPSIWATMFTEIVDIMEQVDEVKKGNNPDWNEPSLWCLVVGKAASVITCSDHMLLARNHGKIEGKREEALPTWFGVLNRY